jgi:hypothetical protein
MDVSKTRALVIRRRSPQRLRGMSSGELHGLALRLIALYHQDRCSSPQMWLMDGCISELEYRARRARRSSWLAPCRCELCAEVGDAQEDRNGASGDQTAGDVL